MRPPKLTPSTVLPKPSVRRAKPRRSTTNCAPKAVRMAQLALSQTCLRQRTCRHTPVEPAILRKPSPSPVAPEAVAETATPAAGLTPKFPRFARVRLWAERTYHYFMPKVGAAVAVTSSLYLYNLATIPGPLTPWSVGFMVLTGTIGLMGFHEGARPVMSFVHRGIETLRPILDASVAATMWAWNGLRELFRSGKKKAIELKNDAVIACRHFKPWKYYKTIALAVLLVALFIAGVARPAAAAKEMLRRRL